MLVVLFSFSLCAEATYVYENKDGEYQTNVDKFIPQSGVKVKNSKLADMMENSTRNAMEGNKGNKSRNVSEYQRQQPKFKVNENNPNRKSYKWF